MGLLAAVLTVSAARAGDQAAPGNPYLAISERNVFALVPIPTNAPVDATPPVDPPPKITPNGTMSIFGQLQVLFKVAMPPKGKEPAKDMSYVMAEGERQDDIAVVKIDQSAAMITFNNHGTVQELPLASAPKLTSPAAAPGALGGIPAVGGMPASRGGGVLPAGLNPAANRFGRAKGPEAVASPTEAAAPINDSAQPAAPKNIEEQVMQVAAEMAKIEQNRIATQDLVDQGKLPPLPPTLLTPKETLDTLVTTPDAVAPTIPVKK